MQQKRETREATSMRTGGRGRTTGRSTRGRYPQRGHAYGSNAADNLYGSDSLDGPRGAGLQDSERPEEQLDPQTQEQIRLWLQTTTDNKIELTSAVQPLIQSEMSSVRAIAVEEGAKKTTAAIDGILLARQERYDKVAVEMEQEQRELQEAQSRQNLGNDPTQAYQQGSRYGGRARRGATTQRNNQQQQNTRRGRRR
jgi:hypothetical protein